MIEYKVRRCDGEGTGEPERVCNDVAKEGWRLVSAAAASADGVETRLYLFFEREASTTPMPDQDAARLAAQFAMAATR